MIHRSYLVRQVCPVLLMLLVACLSGCASHVDRLREARERFHAGDLAGASDALDRQLKRSRTDSDALLLDKAVVELASGRPDQAEQTLRGVRDRFDYLEQTSAGEKALSMVTDDNREAYAGEDYEKILLRAFLALANLMDDGQDANAYALQVGQKQEQIIQAAADAQGNNPKAGYKRVALGAYVNGILREETHVDYDDVARAMVRVVSWEPEFRPGRVDLQRAQSGHHSQTGHGVLYAFTLVGQGPYKEEVAEEPSSAALLVADRIISHNGEHTLPPTIAPIKVPRVVLPYNAIRSVGVSVEGQPAGQTETITDVGRLAVQQYEAVYPEVVGRAVARRVLKKGIVFGAKEATGVEKHSLASFALDAAGVAWEATETADTRCWGLLPDRIQVLRIELPAGQHRIGLQPLGPNGPIGAVAETVVPIADGRNTYLLATFPHDRLVGQILVSRRPDGGSPGQMR
ncbi:MAG: hypothetical protein JW818_02860 [Pirellulales bacterium]|nr:hypothetical protein [Pirellulales bacterium]